MEFRLHEERDLFGQPVPAPTELRKDGRLRKRGYASRPGTGPKGQRCSTCIQCTKITVPGAHAYKCALRAREWTHDLTTDIHPNAPACRDWERKPWRPLPQPNF